MCKSAGSQIRARSDKQKDDFDYFSSTGCRGGGGQIQDSLYNSH